MIMGSIAHLVSIATCGGGFDSARVGLPCFNSLERRHGLELNERKRMISLGLEIFVGQGSTGLESVEVVEVEEESDGVRVSSREYRLTGCEVVCAGASSEGEETLVRCSFLDARNGHLFSPRAIPV